MYSYWPLSITNMNSRVYIYIYNYSLWGNYLVIMCDKLKMLEWMKNLICNRTIYIYLYISKEKKKNRHSIEKIFQTKNICDWLIVVANRLGC